MKQLTEIDRLAKVYASSYASPHHITFTVEGLRNLFYSLNGITGEAQPAPVDMVLYCPKCGTQHIDAPESDEDYTKHLSHGGFDDQWTNPPHKSHLCQGCGHIWRPSDTPTNGVKATASGKDADTAPTQPAEQAKGLEAVENEADDLLRRLGLDPEQYRTDGGYINHLKVKAAIRHPDDYPQLSQCEHQFVHSADLGGRVCVKCGSPERTVYTTPPAQPALEWVGLGGSDLLDLHKVYGVSPDVARAIESKLREKNAGLPVGCHRSHPHEDMDEVCELKTEIARLRNKLASDAKAGGDEPVEFLSNATRYKVVQDSHNGCKIYGLPVELSGKWVALVAADDYAHLKYTRPQPQAEAVTPNKAQSFYLAVCNFLVWLGREGTIHADDPIIDQLSNAMHDIDGGAFKDNLKWPQAEALRVPDGYVLVPVELTPEMLSEWRWAAGHHYDRRKVWAALLSAAPQPAAQTQDRKDET